MRATGSFFLYMVSVVLVVVGLQPSNAMSSGGEWLLVDRNTNATVYVDSGTIRRTGDVIEVWVLDDLKQAHSRGVATYLSSRAQEEHDCANERFRVVALAQFAGEMGTGKVIYERTVESKWTSIPKGTMAQSVWKYVCGKK
jgi:hypothetical protein